MIKTEYRFAASLKSLMAEVPLDSISVTLLAKKCGVKRQTFYYHFHDIYDLLTLVYLNEKMQGIEETSSIKQMVKCVYNYYTANKAFVEATLASACKDLFQEFVYNNCYKCFIRFINANKEEKTLQPNDKKAVARFYSMAFSNSFVYYLSTHRNKTLDGLMLSVCYEDEDSIKASIDKIINAKGRK